MEDGRLFAPYTGAVYEITEPPQGMNSRVFRLRAEKGDFIVKTGATPEIIAEIGREADVLQHLAKSEPASHSVVPRFIGKRGDHFLFTYLPGDGFSTASQAAESKTERVALVYQFGRLLKTIHGWTLPPLLSAFAPVPPNGAQAAQQTCIDKLQSGTMGKRLHYPHSPFHGTKTDDLLQMARCQQTATVSDDTVWGHGDWCVPNALVQGGSVVYAIDWGGGDTLTAATTSPPLCGHCAAINWARF